MSQISMAYRNRKAPEETFHNLELYAFPFS